MNYNPWIGSFEIWDFYENVLAEYLGERQNFEFSIYSSNNITKAIFLKTRKLLTKKIQPTIACIKFLFIFNFFLTGNV